MLRRDGTGQADATVGDGPHRDPSQRLGDEPLCVPNPVCAPAAAAALFRAADPAAHQLTLVDAGSIAGLNSISLHRHGGSCIVSIAFGSYILLYGTRWTWAFQHQPFFGATCFTRF